MSQPEELALHVDQELDDDFTEVNADMLSSLKEERSEVVERMQAIKHDMDVVLAIENFAGAISQKKVVDNTDIAYYNSLVERNESYDISGMHLKNVSLESFSTLVNTASTITATASGMADKAFLAATVVKDGVVAGAALAKLLHEQVQNQIVKIAASWDMVCGLVEKRWLGLTQLVEVYELQHQILEEKYHSLQLPRDAHAFFKVKLYVAKLRNDGRDVSKKDILIKAIVDDSNDVATLGEVFIRNTASFSGADARASRALTLRYPYKQAMVENFNSFNATLKSLADSSLFHEGGVIKPYQAQSRVLVGGKVVTVNYNDESIDEHTKRAQIKQFIANMGFVSVKRRDGTKNDTENVELSNVTIDEAQSIFDSVRRTNVVLADYHRSRVPDLLKDRKSVSDLITFATGLTGGNGAFDTIKRFFGNDDNLKAFNLVAPVAVAKLLATFMGASSFAVFGGLVAASSAAFLVDYMRKYVISNLFSMMDLQYKTTDVIEKFDHDFVDTLVEIHNQGHRVCKKLASSRNWET